MWEEHIVEWLDNYSYRYAGAKNKTPQQIARILDRDGWDASKYKSHMKKDLFKYLDAWFILEIKKMPSISTALRRNPGPADWCPNCFCFNCRLSDEDFW